MRVYLDYKFVLPNKYITVMLFFLDFKTFF